MIKIDISQAKRREIDQMHKKYIEEITAPRLEESIVYDGQDKDFFIALFGDTIEYRTQKITHFCLSDKLTDLVEEFSKIFGACYGFEFSSKKATTNQQEICKRITGKLDCIFYYKGFNNGRKLENGKRWSRHQFITSVGIKVCPYCDRQYITSYEYAVNDERTTADADHYYPKAIYPILQMNIYNMIPSCDVCNSKTKLDNDKRHLYPYIDPSNSLYFQIPLEISDYDVTTILINTRDNPKAIASKEVFKLDKIYQSHLDIATEIKRDIIEYINAVGGEASEIDCSDYYKKIMGIEIPWNESLYNIWFRFMGKELSTEPLLKMKQDIFNQMTRTILK